MKLYLDPRSLWVGYARGARYHYVCPLPAVVVRWPRRVQTPPPTLAYETWASVARTLRERSPETRIGWEPVWCGRP